MRLLGKTALFMCALAVALLPTSAMAERVALIFGNSEYTHATSLNNPANDASDVAGALRKVGFEVDVVLDANHSSMRRALRAFQRKALGSQVAMIYFAGHGIEIDSNNFLLPVDAELQRDVDVAFEAISLDALLVAVEGARELSLVVLDACRENPFTTQMQRSSATRSIGRGLAVVEPTRNTLLAYAARAGTIAFDGETRNSPYARALISSLQTPGLEIGLLFRTVRDKVISETRGQQEPFLYGSLSAEPIYLNPASLRIEQEPEPAPEPQPEETVVIPTPTLPPSVSSNEVELVFWSTIERSTNAADFQAYLDTFPNGVFAGLARNRIAVLAPPAERAVSGLAPETEAPSNEGLAGLGALSDALAAQTQATDGSIVAPSVPAEQSAVGASGAIAGIASSQPLAAPALPGTTVPVQQQPAAVPLPQTQLQAQPQAQALGAPAPSGTAPLNAPTTPGLTVQPSLPGAGNAAPNGSEQFASLPPQQPGVGTQGFAINDPALQAPLERDQVFELQERLAAMGYDTGRPDGISGPRTERAIRAFESDQGLVAVGTATLGVLLRARASLPDATLNAWRAANTAAPQRQSSSSTARRQTSGTTTRRPSTAPQALPNLCYTAANRACYRMPRPLQHCTKVFRLCGARN